MVLQILYYQWESIKAKFEAFGWTVVDIEEGNDIEAIKRNGKS